MLQVWRDVPLHPDDTTGQGQDQHTFEKVEIVQELHAIFRLAVVVIFLGTTPLSRGKDGRISM
jgi:hypothetical protein